MTVRVTTIQRLVGTAAQRGAMNVAERNALNPGSTYFETDTGLLYVLDAETPHEWQQKVVTVGNVTLDGAIPEYQWIHDDVVVPSPAATERAFGVRVNADDSLTVMYWTGTAWQEVS